MTSSATPDMTMALARLVAFYETLSVQSLAQLGSVYAPHASFRDPFNAVHGHAAIQAIFERMFVQVDAPRFIVTGSICQGSQAFLTWEFRFRLRRYRQGEQCIQGATQVFFDAEGRVVAHRDYWDAAEELYEKLPVIGVLMRWLKRLNAH